MIQALRALGLALADLPRPRIFGVVLTGIALTVGLFLALQALVFWLLWRFGPDHLTLPWVGDVPFGHALSWGSLALFPVMGVFLMAPVAAFFAGLFTERVAQTVEDIHYPGRPGRSLDLWDSLMDALAVTAAVVVTTIALLILTPILGPVAPILFYAANGWLLGREFFSLAARRHVSVRATSDLRRDNPVAIITTGVLIALLLTVPVLNIVIPVFAAAAFTHLFHQLNGRSVRSS